MLDQNTDRMWYVIGAVIIGAAIILIMNKTFPQLFASIGDTFTNKTEDVTAEIEGWQTNHIVLDTITYGEWVRETDGLLSTESSGLHWATTDYMRVSPGESYTYRTPAVMRNMRVVYFDEDYNYIEGTKQYEVSELTTISPSNARYVRIAGPYKEYSTFVPVEQWWFGLT